MSTQLPFGNGPHAFRRLRNELDHWLENVSRDVGDWASWSMGGANYPPLNIAEDAQALYLEAELPGWSMNNIEVVVRGNELSLSGDRREDQGAESVYHRRERMQGSFQRLIHLPLPVDAGKVEASLSAGILRITLPKAEEARSRKIQVKAS